MGTQKKSGKKPGKKPGKESRTRSSTGTGSRRGANGKPGAKRAEKRKRDPERDYWALVDYFREMRPAGWIMEPIGFRNIKTVSGGGRKWDVWCSISFDEAHRLSACISFFPDYSSRAYSGKRSDWRSLLNAELTSFLDGTEQRLRRRGYRGVFTLDRDPGSVSAHFRKDLKNVDEARQEIGVMESPLVRLV